MSEFFEKIAAENESLAEIFIKVADEDVVSQMSQEDQLDELLDDLEAAGINLEDPAVLEELKEASADDVYAYNLEKALDIMSEDFLNNVEKLAAGEPGFETAAAAKAVEQFFDINGAAIFGTSFGPGNNSFGTTISPAVDKNVFGGYGKQIMTTNIQPNAVNASGKISGLINGTNMNMIKSASDEEVLNFFYTKLAEAAEFENQTIDEFVHDLGMEALREEVKEASEGKVDGFLKSASKKSKSIFKNKKEEEEEEKEASDIAFGYVEKLASETNSDPEDLVLEYGLEKAAEYLDEVLEKEAAGKMEALGNTAKKLYNREGGRALSGAIVGGGAGAGWAAMKNKKDKDADTKTKVKRYLLGVGGGAAAGAGATALGESAFNAGHTAKNTIKASLKGNRNTAIGTGDKAKTWKDRGFFSKAKADTKSVLKGVGKGVGDEAKRRQSQATEGASKLKGLLTKKSEDSFENTLYELAQQKLYNNNEQ